jgi:5'-phosphate synthase pdxT subunit
MTTIGVLALQGDFLEHEAVLRCLGVDAVQVRKSETLLDLDGLVVPGGESTTVCHLMEEYQLYEPLRRVLGSGLPVWGTCAGMIVLAQRVGGLGYPTLEALDIAVERNAYGRQVDSFETDISIPILGGLPFHAVFIRAPVVSEVGADVEVLARLPAADGGGEEGSPVAVRQGSVLATTFHPELTGDSRLHRYFLGIVESAGRRNKPQ